MFEDINRQIHMIPRTVCDRLNHPNTDDETILYKEYEPSIEPEINNKQSVKRTNIFQSSVYNIFNQNYTNDKEYADEDYLNLDKFNQIVHVYTIGQLRKIYHIMQMKYAFPVKYTMDLSQPASTFLVYEIAAILLNHYDFETKEYDKTSVERTLTEISKNIWYEDVIETLPGQDRKKLNDIVQVYMPDIII